ncbi:MAG TPA: tripartite tricarboxylate transporter substrate-binding protein, partial [Burkholderiales bacterium]|nr:tripartite tricarboxylate transporter substrate-binding protein [Burkholderiales bacterium]
DIPTVAEAGMGDFEATTWIGLYAPAATARPIIDRVHAETAKALGTPDSKQRFAAQGVDVVAGTPEQLAEFLRSETTKWAKVVKDSGARAD